MKPQEKALELMDNIWKEITPSSYSCGRVEARRIALSCAEEIRKNLASEPADSYWEEVKIELKKL